MTVPYPAISRRCRTRSHRDSPSTRRAAAWVGVRAKAKRPGLGVIDAKGREVSRDFKACISNSVQASADAVGVRVAEPRLSVSAKGLRVPTSWPHEGVSRFSHVEPAFAALRDAERCMTGRWGRRATATQARMFTRYACTTRILRNRISGPRGLLGGVERTRAHQCAGKPFPAELFAELAAGEFGRTRLPIHQAMGPRRGNRASSARGFRRDSDPRSDAPPSVVEHPCEGVPSGRLSRRYVSNACVSS